VRFKPDGVEVAVGDGVGVSVTPTKFIANAVP
jgi:hypothetical protein